MPANNDQAYFKNILNLTQMIRIFAQKETFWAVIFYWQASELEVEWF